MAEPNAPAIAAVQRSVIKWEGGVPILKAEPVLTKQSIQSLYPILAAELYEVTDPLDPDFAKYDGMTILEVMVRKQLLAAARTGNVEEVMDRLIGKSLSRGENLNVNVGGTYEDYLKGLKAKMEPPARVVEATVVEERDPHPTDSPGNFDDNEMVFGDLA